MSDRFCLQSNCSVCGTDLNKGEQMLMMAAGDFVDLACPKCGTKWRFWIEVVTRQKKIENNRAKE